MPHLEFLSKCRIVGSLLLDEPTSHKPGLVLAIVSCNDEVDASVDAYNITDVREITSSTS